MTLAFPFPLPGVSAREFALTEQPAPSPSAGPSSRTNEVETAETVPVLNGAGAAFNEENSQ